MVARQSVLNPAPKRQNLEELLDKARKIGVTEEQLQQQRASFAYGNAPESATRITRESASAATKRNKLLCA